MSQFPGQNMDGSYGYGGGYDDYYGGGIGGLGDFVGYYDDYYAKL